MLYRVRLFIQFSATLGTGKKDEVPQQLIAEQEGECREDARQARLYLSQEKNHGKTES